MKQRPRATNAAAAATELRVLVGQFKRRFREKANLGDLPPSQMAVLRRVKADGTYDGHRARAAPECDRSRWARISPCWKRRGSSVARPIPTTGGRPFCL